MLFVLPAPAQASNSGAAAGPFMAVSGKSLPPIGFVRFCRAHPGECDGAVRQARRVRLDAARWDELVRVNDSVNTRIAPVTDLDLYKVAEHWTYPTSAGDCEDYVLLKRRNLIDLGWPAEALLITVVRDRNNDGHAVLTVTTDLGDYVLDNQHPDVLPWNATQYTYTKRQSQTHPYGWVNIGPAAQPRAGALTGETE